MVECVLVDNNASFLLNHALKSASLWWIDIQ